MKESFEANIVKDGYVGQTGWVEETFVEIDKGNVLLEEKLEKFVGKRVLITIQEI